MWPPVKMGLTALCRVKGTGCGLGGEEALLGVCPGRETGFRFGAGLAENMVGFLQAQVSARVSLFSRVSDAPPIAAACSSAGFSETSCGKEEVPGGHPSCHSVTKQHLSVAALGSALTQEALSPPRGRGRHLWL